MYTLRHNLTILLFHEKATFCSWDIQFSCFKLLQQLWSYGVMMNINRQGGKRFWMYQIVNSKYIVHLSVMALDQRADIAIGNIFKKYFTRCGGMGLKSRFFLIY